MAQGRPGIDSGDDARLDLVSHSAHFRDPAAHERWQSPLADLSIECGHIHSDGARILKLLPQFANVKVCISGHLHRIDHVEIKGIHFHCAGAVCGRWWRGANDGFPEGYSLIDLNSDGTYAWQYVPYGWNAATTS